MLRCSPGFTLMLNSPFRLETTFCPLDVQTTAPMRGSFVSASSTTPDATFCANAPPHAAEREQSKRTLLKVIMNTNNVIFKNVCKVKTIVNSRQYLEISKCRYLCALVCGAVLAMGAGTVQQHDVWHVQNKWPLRFVRCTLFRPSPPFLLLYGIFGLPFQSHRALCSFKK